MVDFASLVPGDIIVLTTPRDATATYYQDELGITVHPTGAAFVFVLHDKADIGVHLLVDGVPVPNPRGLHYCMWFKSPESSNFDLQLRYGTTRILKLKGHT